MIKDASETAADPPSIAATCRGLWALTWRARLTVRKIPLLVLSIGTAPVLAFFAAEPGESDGYVDLVIGVYLLLLLPIYCLAVCGSMIRDELQAGTLGFLLTRPLKRSRLFLIEFAAHTLWIQMIALANGLLLILVGVARSVPGVLELGCWLLWVQGLAVLAYGSLSALLGLVTRRYIVLGIVYGFIVEIGIGRVPINIHLLSMTHHIQSLLGSVAIVHDAVGWEPGKPWVAIAALCAATTIFLILGSVLFTWREYHAKDDMRR